MKATDSYSNNPKSRSRTTKSDKKGWIEICGYEEILILVELCPYNIICLELILCHSMIFWEGCTHHSTPNPDKVLEFYLSLVIVVYNLSGHSGRQKKRWTKQLSQIDQYIVLCTNQGWLHQAVIKINQKISKYQSLVFPIGHFHCASKNAQEVSLGPGGRDPTDECFPDLFLKGEAKSTVDQASVLKTDSLGRHASLLWPKQVYAWLNSEGRLHTSLPHTFLLWGEAPYLFWGPRFPSTF